VTSVLLSPSQRESLERATATYEASVGQVAQYLAGRGITEQTAHTYRLGYVAEPVRGDDEYVGRLAIPYVTTSGVVDIRFRSVLPGDEPKYKSKPGSTLRLFGVTAMSKPGSSIAVCEGEIDTITLNQCGVNAVGVPGANAWKSHWQLLFNDYDEVVVVCDGDQAGRDHGKRMAERIDNVIVVNLPDGADVNSYYLSEGKDALLERIGL
jgi:DNA primase